MGTHPPNPLRSVDVDAVRERCAKLLGAHPGAGWDVIAFLLERRVEDLDRAGMLVARLLDAGDDLTAKDAQAARAFLDGSDTPRAAPAVALT